VEKILKLVQGVNIVRQVFVGQEELVVPNPHRMSATAIAIVQVMMLQAQVTDNVLALNSGVVNKIMEHLYYQIRTYFEQN